MQTFLWFMLLPILCGIVLAIVLPRRNKQNLQLTAIYTVITSIVVAVTFAGASAISFADVEIINGQVTAKNRVHDEYTRSYDCFCTTNKKGHRTCQTCTEQRYTVSWDIETTVGGVNVEKLDKDSKRVYLSPDPRQYANATIGEPASRRNHYINYVQAVPNSLFTPATRDLREKFKNLIPAYPDKIYNLYKNDHVLSPGHNLDLSEWNNLVANELRTLGREKQVNLIFVIAKTADPQYEYAIRDAWENGNKNDVIVLIGSTMFPRIDFARVITWSKSEIFKIELRDKILEHAKMDNDIIHLTVKQIKTNFERRHMSEFEYLQSEVEPPMWVLICLVFCIFVSAGFTYIKFKD